MQQMTDQQRGLNQETSQIPLPSANPSSLPLEARAQMARLAAEQQQIRKGLDELQQEVEEGGEVVGKLDQILEDMRQVERDLERAELSPETREKQEKILSRMLDAQRSIRERGYRRDRRSRSGTETPAASPEDVPRTLTEMRERVKEDPVREQGLVVPPEYEELIRSYYRSLTGEK
jgi:chromosome segregation ATPase